MVRDPDGHVICLEASSNNSFLENHIETRR
jgi:hypothetical protein